MPNPIYSRHGLTGQYTPVFTGYLAGLYIVRNKAELRVIYITTPRTTSQARNQ